MKYNSFQEFANSNSSEKIVVAHLEGVRRLLNFTLDVPTGLYKKTVRNFVTAVEDGVTEQPLVQVFSTDDVETGKFYYDDQSNTLWLAEYDQQTSEVIATFRYFLSNAPVNLPWDLQEGSTVVSYDARLIGFPSFSSQYAQGKKSIALVGSGTLQIENQDGWFNDSFDKLTWENKIVRVFVTHRDLPASEAKLIFRGYVTTKSFETRSVSFGVKDEIFSLNQEIPLGEYDDEKANRWIYGKADGVSIVSVDQVGDGIAIEGTIRGTFGSNIIAGIGTSFLTQLTERDVVSVGTLQLTVESVVSDVVFTATESMPQNFLTSSATFRPELSDYTKNRTFNVCGHQLFTATSPITRVNGKNRFEVEDASTLEAGDFVTINDNLRQIRRVSNNADGIRNSLVLATNIDIIPEVGDLVTRAPLRNLRYNIDGKERAIQTSDYSFTNDSNGVTITISGQAEFNATPTQILRQTLTFIKNSRYIWYGAPTIIDLVLTPVNRVVDGITGLVFLDIWNKWFALVDEENRRSVFWFSNGTSIVPDTIQAVANAVPGSRLIEVPVTLQTSVIGQVLTAEQLGVILMARLPEASFFQAEQNGGTIRLSSSNIKDAIQTTVISSTTVVTGTTPITPSVLTGSTSFTRTIQTTGTSVLNQNTKLSTILKPRDFVQASVGDGIFYEILAVDDNKITLRDPWNPLSTSNLVASLNYKAIDYIQDNTPVYVDVTSGKADENGDLIDSHPKIVRDILRSIGLGSFVDESTFISAHNRSPYFPSLTIPLQQGDRQPQAKSIIELCNKTIQGSLHLTDALNLGYDVYDGALTIDTTIREDDCISWSSDGDANDLFLRTEVRYRFSDTAPNQFLSFESPFARKYVKSTFVQVKDYYLYNTDEALELAQRDQFINNISTTIVKIRTGIKYANTPIGARVSLNLRGFYIPFGADAAVIRTGIITKKTVVGSQVSLEISDLGAILLRTAKIASDDADDWATTSEELRPFVGFIVDDSGIVENDEWMEGTQLIS